MMKPTVKRIVKLSWIMGSAREEFEKMKKHPDLDADFFNENELAHYVGVIIKSHEDDWLIIDDRNEDERIV